MEVPAMRTLALLVLLATFSVSADAAPNPRTHPLVVKDAKGKLVGRMASLVTGHIDIARVLGTVVLAAKGLPHAALPVTTAGFVDTAESDPNVGDQSSELYYTGSLCTGPPLILIRSPEQFTPARPSSTADASTSKTAPRRSRPPSRRRSSFSATTA
jgi:hypothetical protein